MAIRAEFAQSISPGMVNKGFLPVFPLVFRVALEGVFR